MRIYHTLKALQSFSSIVYQQSGLFWGEISQSKYERAMNFVLTKMQNFM